MGTTAKLSEVVAAAKLLIRLGVQAEFRHKDVIARWVTRARRSCRCGHYHKFGTLAQVRRDQVCRACEPTARKCIRFVPAYAVQLGLRLK
jgi:hypothetical protein